MNGLMIDDAMVALGPSGEFAEGRVEEFIGRTALLRMLERHGYDGTGGVRDLAAGIDSWRVATGRHGRVCPASTKYAESCCLIQKCYRNFSTWGPPQPALIPALQGVPPWARQPWRRPALCS